MSRKSFEPVVHVAFVPPGVPCSAQELLLPKIYIANTSVSFSHFFNREKNTKGERGYGKRRYLTFVLKGPLSFTFAAHFLEPQHLNRVSCVDISLPLPFPLLCFALLCCFSVCLSIDPRAGALTSNRTGMLCLVMLRCLNLCSPTVVHDPEISPLDISENSNPEI